MNRTIHQPRANLSRGVVYAFVATGCLRRNASFVRLHELGREFALQGVETHFLLDDTEHNRSLTESLAPARVQLIAGRTRKKRLLARRDVLRDLRPHAVHILNPLFLNTCSVTRLGIPIVCDWDELSSAREKRLARWPATLVVERIARRLASLNVVASRCLQQLFQSRFGIESLYLPYAAYLPDRPTGPNPFVRPTAVYLGNLVPDFDHDIVIDAWDLLKRRGVALDLAIMGGGELLDSVRRDVAERGLTNVHLEGYITGQPMWDRLRHAHVLLFPIRDNTGNRSRCPSKTFAYMQAGRPIIANHVGEVAEALGDLAEYVAATPEAFADAVARIADRQLPDVAYPLHLHTWSDRASQLLAALRDRGIILQTVPACG